MKELIINGVTSKLDIKENWNFENLFNHINNTYSSSTQEIQSFKVNGVEIIENKEKSLKEISMSNIERIEVKTIHPHTLAVETLEILSDFLKSVIYFCEKSLFENRSEYEFNNKFLQLLDGIDVLNETILNARRVLNVGANEILDTLHEDLSSILQEILIHRKKNDLINIKLVIENRLIQNLENWISKGLKYLIRAKDH